MRVGEHRNLCPLLRERSNKISHLVHCLPQHLLTIAKHQSVGHIVDVFGSAAEMNELGTLCERRAGDFLFEKKFYGFDIVVCRALNFFNARGIIEREILGYRTKILALLR